MKEWLKNSVFYEVYPQSFYDTNADGIGDIPGVIEKLDYIKEMGFTAIWMNPCFESPFHDAGYDVSDYYKVAARYGTNDDIKRLCSEAHKRGIRVLLDFVPGHTSIEHPWFKESKKAEKNKYSDKYIWTDCMWKDIKNVLDVAGTIRGISERDGSCAVNFFSFQPCLNYGFAKVTESWQCAVNSPEAMENRKMLVDIMCFWLKMGCDGFRIDLAHTLVKEDIDKTETIKLWREVLSEVNRKYPEAAFVSEWGEPDKAISGGFDMDFLLPYGDSHYLDLFRTDDCYFSHSGEGDLTEFFKAYQKTLEKTSGNGFICIPSGNHDIKRISYKLDEAELKLAYLFLMTMPGVPYIYNGDEIGMRYIDGLVSVEGGYDRTGSRTPMQWDSSKNAGFSNAPSEKLYIVQDSSADRPTVKAQMNDESSVLNELKRLIHFRRANEELQESASFELICDGYPLAYIRGGKYLILINPSDTKKSINFDRAPVNTGYQIGNKIEYNEHNYKVPPCSASVIEIG